jgi:N-acetylglucosaminyl-diphospho-decaprenol L-rhamnosyltransferase
MWQMREAFVEIDSAQMFKNLEPPAVCPSQVTISIVSHGHGSMVIDLLRDLAMVTDCTFDVVLTLNIAEVESFKEYIWPFKVTVIRNLRPRGFAQNHNTAFSTSNSPFFCIINPDIRLHKGSINALIHSLGDPSCGAAGPLVLSPQLGVEDSARKFPTLPRLAKRFITGVRESEYKIGHSLLSVDWLAGMFVVFGRETYVTVGGFDEGFFMYLEDVDICRRIRAKNLQVCLNPEFQVIHAAQRASKKNIQHLTWHIRSVFRYFFAVGCMRGRDRVSPRLY